MITPRSRGFRRRKSTAVALFIFVYAYHKFEKAAEVLYFQEQELNFPQNCTASLDDDTVDIPTSYSRKAGEQVVVRGSNTIKKDVG